MSDLLIVQCKSILKPREFERVYENLLNQKAYGLLLLPPNFEALLVPEDVEVCLTETKVVPETLDLRRRWIPCSEQLPEKDGIYLVTVNFLNDRPTFADFMNGRWITHMDDHVLAWMPMPEVYKGE